MAAPSLIVEIHDVSPAALHAVQTLDGALATVGVERPSMLVVPLYRDELGRPHDLREHRPTRLWLRHKREQGVEVVQHGLTHRAPGPPPAGLRNAMMHHWFSRGCAEFAHLTEREAEDRLTLGRRILDDCGLHADGFVAPAWQQSPAALRAVSRSGFRFTAFLGHVLALNGMLRKRSSPALTFDTPYPAIDLGKRAVMRGWAKLMRSATLVRVALHPGDVLARGRLRHILRRVEALMEQRRLVSYAEWFA